MVARDGHPGRQADGGEVQKLVQMEANLHRRVIGQDEAVQAVSNASAGPARPVDPNRPIGSFIFWAHRRWEDRAGAQLAEFMFDDERAMSKVDRHEQHGAELLRR